MLKSTFPEIYRLDIRNAGLLGKTQFIDASCEDFFKKEINNNIFTKEHIEKIMQFFDRKEDL